MTEFKQIVGRGTRLRPDFGKNFFTIIDFRNATALFNDEDWDGPPIQDDQFGVGQSPAEAEPKAVSPDLGVNDVPSERVKYQVGRQEFMVARERISYYDKEGKLTTESLKDYNRRAINDAYQSLERFLGKWNEADRKSAILEELQSHGVMVEALAKQVGEEYDLFDLICHVAFDQPPRTRQERANQVRKRDVFTNYGETARAVLEGLLDKYADQGVVSIENAKVLQLEPFAQLGTPVELLKQFGGKKQYRAAVSELARMLYDDESVDSGA